MAVVFTALDNEFAASTGANVNNGVNTSTFDYPPNSSISLVISAQDGDASPYIFSLGDTYDLSWGGMGGGGTITDAVVIRTDPAPDMGGGGVVVFEGYDGADLVQIVWTPGFDLEGWYWSNFSGGNPLGFYTTDQSGTYTHTYVCFATGTLITTPQGQVPVERLRPGDLVQTRDHGLQPLRWAGGKTAMGLDRAAPVHFAAGAIGNARPLTLSQQHRVLVTSPLAEMYFFSSEVLVPAKALVNHTTVRIIPCGRIGYHHLLFDQHEVIWAEGALCESLLLASESLRSVDPQAAEEEAALLPGIADRMRPGHIRAARPILTYREALLLADSFTPAGPALAVPDVVL